MDVDEFMATSPTSSESDVQEDEEDEAMLVEEDLQSEKIR